MGGSIWALMNAQVFIGCISWEDGDCVGLIGLTIGDGNVNRDFGVWEKVGNAEVILFPEEIGNVAFINVEFASCAVLKFFPQTCVMGDDFVVGKVVMVRR